MRPFPWRDAALAWVRAVALLVPGERRADWREEWRGEIEAGMGAAAGPGERRRVAIRAVGALSDALYLRGEGTTMEWLRSDVRFALRGLRTRPGFAAVAVGTLALAVGANTALYTVVRGVLLRPLPYEEPDRLVRIESHRPDDPEGGPVSYPNMWDLREQAADVFSGLAVLDEWRPVLTEGDRVEVLHGATVSADFFGVLGVEPAVGRFFGPGEEGEGREPVVVLSHDLWRSRFASDPGVVGRSLELSGTPFTVIGVMGEGFEDPQLHGGSWEDPDVWRTVWFAPGDRARSGRSWSAVARLAPGVGLRGGEARVRTLFEMLAERYPEDNGERTLALVALDETLVGEARPVLLVLLGAVALVLLVACANVASLLLGRAAERRREISVRLALGASRRRIVTQLLVESFLLAALGTVLGVGVALVGLDALVGLAGNALPRARGITLDGGVLLFTVALAGLTPLFFGVAPAVHALRGAGHEGSMDSRTRTPGPSGHRFRRGLVVAELAVSLVLLVGAGLLLRSLGALYDTDLGVDVDQAVVLTLHGSGFWNLEADEAAARWTSVMEATRAVPGVTTVGAIHIPPLSSSFWCDGVYRDDLPPTEGPQPCAEFRATMGDVFPALGMQLVRGRLLAPEDRADAPRAMVVSRAAGRTFWPDGADPVGGSVTLHGESFTVVGMVEDVHPFGPADGARPMVFVPAVQEPWNDTRIGMSLIVRGTGDMEARIPALRAAVASVDPAIPFEDARTLVSYLGESVRANRFRAVLLGAFAGVALLLALVGVAGVMAFSISRRTRELGIRAALGADRRALVGLVVREGASMAVAGGVIGLAGAFLGSRVLASLLFGVTVHDPVVFATLPALLIAAALLACWVPARRASRLDPSDALRLE